MARVLVNSESDYLTVATSPVAAVPLTFSVWIKPTSVGAIPHGWILSVSRADTNNNFALRHAQGDGTLVTMDVNNTAEGVAAGFTAGSWQHLACRAVSTTSRFAYRNGVQTNAEATGSQNPTAQTQTDIGRYPGGGTNGFDGLIAEPAIWDVALSGSDVAALAAGASPMSLTTPPVRYWRFKDDLDLTDLIAASVLTNNGTTWSSDHPTVNDPPVASLGNYINPAIAPGLRRPGVLRRPHDLYVPQPDALPATAESWGPVPS